MNHYTNFNCKNCNCADASQLLIKEDSIGKLICCKLCRTTTRIPNEKPDEKKTKYITRYETGLTALHSYQFGVAENAFSDALSLFPDQAEALWGKICARYGIIEVHSYEEKCYKATYCHWGENDLRQDREIVQLEQSIERLDNDLKTFYRERLEDAKQQLTKIHETVRQGTKQYDVFIACKISRKTDAKPDATGMTDEFKWATKLYHNLEHRGVKVFFSHESLELGQVDYDWQIFNALLSSKNFVLVSGSKHNEDYLNSPWVKSEWKRWLYMMEKGYNDKNSFYILRVDAECRNYPSEIDSMHIQKVNPEGMADLVERLVGRVEPPFPPKHGGIDEHIIVQKLNQARFFCRSKNYDGAMRLYNELIEAVPNDIRGYIGVVRVTSKNFTVRDEEGLDELIADIARLCSENPSQKLDDDYVKYLKDREKDPSPPPPPPPPLTPGQLTAAHQNATERLSFLNRKKKYLEQQQHKLAGSLKIYNSPRLLILVCAIVLITSVAAVGVFLWTAVEDIFAVDSYYGSGNYTDGSYPSYSDPVYNNSYTGNNYSSYDNGYSSYDNGYSSYNGYTTPSSSSTSSSSSGILDVLGEIGLLGDWLDASNSPWVQALSSIAGLLIVHFVASIIMLKMGKKSALWILLNLITYGIFTFVCAIVFMVKSKKQLSATKNPRVRMFSRQVQKTETEIKETKEALLVIKRKIATNGLSKE